MTALCRTCRINDAAYGSLCAPCWSDRQAAARAKEQAAEAARIEASRNGRPGWRPERAGGHGHNLPPRPIR